MRSSIEAEEPVNGTGVSYAKDCVRL